MQPEEKSRDSRQVEQPAESADTRAEWIKPALTRIPVADTASGSPFTDEETPYTNAT